MSKMTKKKGEVTKEFDPVKNAKAVEKLKAARVRMVMKHPFWAQFAVNMRLINADAWCETAATNGKDFFYNTDFILDLDGIDQVVFLFAHETLHCVYDHVNRTGDRIRMLANVAQDYVINADLVQSNVGKLLPEGCYERKYYGWNFERVYDDLMKDAKIQEMTMEELADMLIDDHLINESGSGSGGDQEGDGKGDIEDNGDGTGVSKSRPKMTEEEREEMKQQIRDTLINAAASQQAGSLPANLERLIKELREPVMNWKDLIDVAIPSLQKDDYSYTRINKKYASAGLVFPGVSEGERIDVAVAIDTSGSISQDQLEEMFSEVVGLMEMYDDYIVRIWQFDTDTYNYAEFTKYNQDEIEEYELKGGGGTDFEANWKLMKDNEIEPQLFIMFTDGYPWNSWGDPEYCDTLFIINNEYDHSIEAPFGRTAYYNT